MAAADGDNDVDTEQTFTCLNIKMYHPLQHDRRIFSALELCKRQEIGAEEVVMFGRDVTCCKFKLLHNKVSRMQFALQFFKQINSSTMSFEIKNLSKKTKLYVDGLELTYLNKVDLPPKCLIRFGEFQMLLENEAGESEDKFAIYCEVSRFSLVQEIGYPVMLAIPENGPIYQANSQPLSIPPTPPPVEVDENDV
ncbi:TRAF-interacting protein with FHA domain-containing protein A isoform X2 [Hyla sarda]|nr:TRAF-interacting protein with FHA domain-containing protein A isoform X2 [Hyla sarda]XP_056420894.1 TRAF-interacting protein with FHA domain-containing protein A isoform X2 [Hyla sarda]XP_056420899.1 TRAF-interacting protein with FHA domain-containing protein A isoform X2 [Hyla sarda]